MGKLETLENSPSLSPIPARRGPIVFISHSFLERLFFTSAMRSSARLPQNAPGNDDSLHLACPLVDRRHAHIPVEPFHAELLRVAIAAVDLHSFVGYDLGHLRREELRHRRFPWPVA